MWRCFQLLRRGRRAPRSGAPSPTPTTVWTPGSRGSASAPTPSTLWTPWPTEQQRLDICTFYTLDTVAHGATRRPLHLLHVGHRGARVVGADLTLARPPSGFWVTSQRPRRWLARDQVLQSTPNWEHSFPTSLFLPLSRPAIRRAQLRQTERRTHQNGVTSVGIRHSGMESKCFPAQGRGISSATYYSSRISCVGPRESTGHGE